MTIIVENEDGTAATLPVTPPATVCLSLSPDCIPGTIDLRASDPFFDPKTVDIAAVGDRQCFKIGGNITGLLAQSTGSDDVTIV